MTQGLRRALVLSILFHLFLLASARQLPWLPESQGKMAGVPIFASLRSDARVLPLDQPPERTTQAYEVPMVVPRELLKGPAVEKNSANAQDFSPSTVTDNVAVVDKNAAIAVQPVLAPLARVAQAEEVSLDGVRQYRLSLAREARQAKTYPDLARERGTEGVVVVVVTTVAGAGLPQVELSQSSGSDLLDRAAIDLVELAVRSARMPESLRGQQFALTLPIHYRLSN